MKDLYVHALVKDSKNNIEKYLFSELERCNSTIDELEQRIDKAILWLNIHGVCENKWNTTVDWTILAKSEPLELLDILGGKDE